MTGFEDREIRGKIHRAPQWSSKQSERIELPRQEKMPYLISVIVPCFNQSDYLPKTLQSVYGQSYPDWECLIINDGSTDATEEVALDWVKKDERFRYFKKENGGLSSARNCGLGLIKGDYVQFLDSDDFIDKEKFKISMDVVGENTSTLVISDFVEFDESSKKIRPSLWCDLNKVDVTFQNILLEWDVSFTIPIHCGIFPLIYFDKISFDESLGAKEDWLMWLSIFKKLQPEVIYINKPLAIYRRGHYGMTKNQDIMNKNIHKAFEKVYNEFVCEKNKDAYFRKVNRYWYKQLQISERKKQQITDSRIYRFSEKIASPIRVMRNIISRNITSK